MRTSLLIQIILREFDFLTILSMYHGSSNLRPLHVPKNTDDLAKDDRVAHIMMMMIHQLARGSEKQRVHSRMNMVPKSQVPTLSNVTSQSILTRGMPRDQEAYPTKARKNQSLLLIIQLRQIKASRSRTWLALVEVPLLGSTSSTPL